MRRLLFIVTGLFTLLPLSAQDWEMIKADTETYLFGEGVGVTVDEADQAALSNLLSKISLVVSSEFSITTDETTQNGELDSETYTTAKIQTYSASTLTNTERFTISSSPDEYVIGRYVKRTEVNRIFEGRLLSLKEYVRLGRVAESKLKIDDALRNYYWAFALLKSVQHPATVTYEEVGYEPFQLMSWLPEKLNELLSGLSAKVVRNDGSNLYLNFTYDGKPVNSLDYCYFDGRNWSNISSAKDGIGIMEFSKDMIPDNVQCNFEYAYRSQAHINPEVKAVLAVVKGQPLRKSRITISSQPMEELLASNSQAQAITESKAEMEASGIDTTSPILTVTDNGAALTSSETLDPSEYKEVIDQILVAVQSKNYSNLDQYFTTDGMDMFNKLLRYGNAKIVNSDNLEFYEYREGVVGRGVQFSFSFKNGSRQNFIEDIVFTFDADKKVDCVAFGLGEVARADIMGKEVWPLLARRALMEFLENYKTAYSLKRLDYLKTIFDDNAVIIVGHVAQVMKNSSLGDNMEAARIERRVSHTRYTKEEYMKKLEACFGSNEFINIRFANNDIRKAARGEEYGIQIKQDYFSSNYGDEGYLYLQVDITDPKQPVIKVRAWQEQPDPEWGLYDMGNW